MKVTFRATINFESLNTDLNYVADIVSERLVGKKGQLSGFENYIRDEVPTVYSNNILGLRVILMQNPEDETQFQIELLDRMNTMTNKDLQSHNMFDISNRLYELLKTCDEFIFPSNYKD